MHWFRTIRAFIRVLIGLFMLAQLAGVVSSPIAAAPAAASHVHHQHAHMHPGASHETAGAHGQQSKGHVDDCCALHAFFAGVLPSVAVVTDATPSGERLAIRLTESGAGIPPGGLDRPPKPLP